MDKHKFLQLYWKNYISIEKEFVQTLNYVALDEENYNVFSSAYIKILLQIGSEIDIVTKSFCIFHDKSLKLKNINDYRCEIMKRETDFGNTKVIVLQGNDICPIKPWEVWNDNNCIGKDINPNWWKVYNKVKHNRTDSGTIEDVDKDYYKFANLKYTLFALAGLYQLLIYYYYDLAEEERIKVPIPGSHLLTLSGNKWDDIIFYQDIAFYIDFSSGELHSESGEFIY